METIKRTIQNQMQDKYMSRIRTHRKCWKYHKGENSDSSGAGFLKFGTNDIWGWITPRRLGSKESASQCRRHGFNPWAGKYPGKGNDYPFQYSCLENHMERGAWWATVHGVTKSRTQLSNWTRTHSPTTLSPELEIFFIQWLCTD